MVMLARHLPEGHPRDEHASKVPGDKDLVSKISKIIRERAATVSPEELSATVEELRDKFEHWEDWAEENLRYGENPTEQLQSLLHNINHPPSRPGWRTMDSMRSVDHETLVRVYGEPRGRDEKESYAEAKPSSPLGREQSGIMTNSLLLHWTSVAGRQRIRSYWMTVVFLEALGASELFTPPALDKDELQRRSPFKVSEVALLY